MNFAADLTPEQLAIAQRNVGARVLLNGESYSVGITAYDPIRTGSSVKRLNLEPCEMIITLAHRECQKLVDSLSSHFAQV